ncbi:MAG TPA: ATP-binding protein, partial [Bryobacteraceae bacterium]|nr:ATP-binding protein [Bryobacteraceae bacterium]
GAVIQRAVASRQPLRNVAVTLERPNLPPVPLHVSVESVDVDDHNAGSGTVIALREVGSAKPAEMRSGDTATRIAAISKITSGVAHEIKNPLNAMMLHLEIVRERLGAQHPELEIVRSELVRLDRVVKSLLEFHKPVEVHLAECDLCSIADQVAQLIRPQASADGIEVTVTPENQAPIMADCDLLKQAVLNVAVNALEAMKTGGGLRFRIRTVEAQCCLDVEDDGPGIPADIRDKIFNLYFTTKQAGTGVGLAMTYRIVQLHSGAIRVESEPGKGARFIFQFPKVGSREIAA